MNVRDSIGVLCGNPLVTKECYQGLCHHRWSLSLGYRNIVTDITLAKTVLLVHTEVEDMVLSRI